MTRVEVGQRYAYRESPDTWLKPLLPVEVLKLGPTPRSGKVRVRWPGGEWEGLDVWVPHRRLVVPWADVDAFLEDERRTVAVLEATGETVDAVEHEAVDRVFEAAGVVVSADHQQLSTGLHAYDDLLLTIPAFAATAAACGLDAAALAAEPHAFVDRTGTYWAPFAAARELAQTLGRRHGRAILEDLRDQEDALRQATVSGLYLPRHSRWRDPSISPEYAAGWLRTDEPVSARVAAWCGGPTREDFDRERAFRAEIARLRALVTSTAAFLEANGHPWKAKLIQQALNDPGVSDSTGGAV